MRLVRSKTQEETMAKIRVVITFVIAQVVKSTTTTLTANHWTISSVIELSDATGM